MKRSIESRRFRWFMPVAALWTVLTLMMMSTSVALANSVNIQDQSGVLDASRVRSEAQKLQANVLVITTNSFRGDQSALNQDARLRLPDQKSVVVEIDTVNRHLSVQSGDKVRLSDSQAQDAVSAFSSNYNNGDYTGATVAALSSVNNSLRGTQLTPLGVLVAVFLGIAAVVVIVMIIVTIRKRSGTPGGGRGPWGRRRGYWSNGVFYPYPGPYADSGSRSSGGNSSFGGGRFGGGSGGGFGGGDFGGGDMGGGDISF